MQSRKDFLKSLVFGAGAATLAPKALSTAYDEGDEPLVFTAVDKYNFKMTLQVPQVFDNTASQGYRAYRPQKVSGPMYISWLEDGSFVVQFGRLENSNFKVGGANVTYTALEQKDVVYSRFVYIGSNKTDTFTKPCLCFYAQFEPSYAIGEPKEDNSFSLMFAGKGRSAYKRGICARVATRLSGYAAGMQGCGCADYGHKSPTRNAGVSGPTKLVNDVVACYGSWRATWEGRTGN